MLRTLTKIHKVYVEMSKVQNRRLSTLSRGQKPSPEFEKSYEKHRKKIVELVRTVHINANRIEQLKLALYDLNRKLMMLEGKLLRLAESFRINAPGLPRQLPDPRDRPELARQGRQALGQGLEGLRQEADAPTSRRSATRSR